MLNNNDKDDIIENSKVEIIRKNECNDNEILNKANKIGKLIKMTDIVWIIISVLAVLGTIILLRNYNNYYNRISKTKSNVISSTYEIDDFTVKTNLSPEDYEAKIIAILQYYFLLSSIVYIIISVVCIININKLKKATNNAKIKDQILKISKKCKNNIIIGVLVYCFVQFIWGSIRTVAKPVIYLYPKKKEKITVQALKPEKFSVTYPKYVDGWRVEAEPNGDLRDLDTNRKLYCLYYEGKNCFVNGKIKDGEKYVSSDFEKGFCVKGDDTVEFLEGKLSELGLTEREANEFIIYWLPKMQDNKYNLIKFETTEKMNEIMPLEITPTPDTEIRIYMIYKPINKFKDIEEQKFVTPERKGFTMVEWGGTELKK